VSGGPERPARISSPRSGDAPAGLRWNARSPARRSVSTQTVPSGFPSELRGPSWNARRFDGPALGQAFQKGSGTADGKPNGTGEGGLRASRRADRDRWFSKRARETEGNTSYGHGARGRADERSKMVPESRRSTFPDQAACVSGHLSSNGSAERTRSRSPCTRRGNPVQPGTRPLASDGRLPGRHSAALRSAARSRRPSRTRRSEAVQESPRPLEAARPLAPSPTHGESRASTRFLTAGTGSRSVPAAPATPRSRRRGARTDSPGAPDPSPRAAPADRTPAAHEAR